MFDVAIQAAIGARSSPARRSRRCARTCWPKCYGGDITPQEASCSKAEGRQEAHEGMVGSVEIPQEALLRVVRGGAVQDPVVVDAARRWRSATSSPSTSSPYGLRPAHRRGRRWSRWATRSGRRRRFPLPGQPEPGLHQARGRRGRGRRPYAGQKLTVNGVPCCRRSQDGTYGYLENLRFETTGTLPGAGRRADRGRRRHPAQPAGAARLSTRTIRPFPGRENCDYNDRGFTCKVPLVTTS